MESVTNWLGGGNATTNLKKRRIQIQQAHCPISLRSRIRELVEKLIFTGGLGRFQSGGDSCTMFTTCLVRLTLPRRQNRVHAVHPKRNETQMPIQSPSLWQWCTKDRQTVFHRHIATLALRNENDVPDINANRLCS